MVVGVTVVFVVFVVLVVLSVGLMVLVFVLGLCWC